MKGIATVGILILTVFLSISVLPACADTIPSGPPGPPVVLIGYVENEDGAPADGAIVTVNANGASVEVLVGSSYGASGWWMANVAPIGVSAGDEVTTVVTTNDGSSTGSATHVVDSTSEVSLVSEIVLIPATGVSSGNDGGSREGTYPPGWGETPIPTPTPEPEDTPTSTDTTEPPVTISDDDDADDDAVPPTEMATEDETDTKTPLGTDPTKKTPGFGAVFMIAGLLAAVYLVLHRRE
ncbi:MAG: PGF-CTERM sorting domain-containing protein [Euryarchaeota archaeon]|nr:PGF-CTERM sorting domain-containing protein [Euryarchaeota archaeon]